MPRLRVGPAKSRYQPLFSEQGKQSARSDKKSTNENQAGSEEKTPPPPSPKPDAYQFDRRTPTPLRDREDHETKHLHGTYSKAVDSDDLMKRLREEASKPEQNLPIPHQRTESARSKRRRRERAEEMSISAAKANEVEDEEVMSDDPRINNYAQVFASTPYLYTSAQMLGTPAIVRGEGGLGAMDVVLADGSGWWGREGRWLEERVKWTRRRSVVERIAGGIEGAWVERGGSGVGVWGVRTRAGQGVE